MRFSATITFDCDICTSSITIELDWEEDDLRVNGRTVHKAACKLDDQTEWMFDLDSRIGLCADCASRVKRDRFETNQGFDDEYE